MKYQKVEDGIVLSLAKNEKIIESVEKFCGENKIENAWIEAIGAVDKAEVAHYSVSDKKYSSFKLDEALEMVSLLGNVFLGSDGKRIIHLHVTFGRPDGSLIGGHLVEARIAAACEMVVRPWKSKMVKKYDEETGLKLLKI